MRVLGLDPGVADTGWGVIDVTGNQLAAVAYGSIKTPAKQPLKERLVSIHDQLHQLIAEHQPDKAAVEELFFYKNVTTAIAVGQARGVLLLTLHQHQLPISEFTPLQVKQAVTSYGSADKQQVQRMVQTLLSLKEIPQPDDAADALAVAICAAQSPLTEQIKNG